MKATRLLCFLAALPLVAGSVRVYVTNSAAITSR